MRKLPITLLLTISFFRVLADEGIWLPFLLGTQVYNNMVKKGLKLSKDQLYHLNKTSLKDAIVVISGNTTASIISDQGLIISSYSKNKDAIADALIAVNQKLHQGYNASSKKEELPTGLHAEVLLRIEDVTEAISDSVGILSGRDRLIKKNVLFSAIANRYSDPETNTVARVSELFQGKQYLVFVYQRYNDIRLVNVPDARLAAPGNIHSYFDWPAYSADFAVLRIYTNVAGNGGEYAAGNIPKTTKVVLPISLKGFKEGDFTMVLGYPTKTDRYALSPGVELARNFTNPANIELRSMQQKAIAGSNNKDSVVPSNINYRNERLSRELKYYLGETEQLGNPIQRQRLDSLEESFNLWAKSSPEYQSTLSDLKNAYEVWKPYSKHQVYIADGFFTSYLFRFAAMLQPVENALVKRGSGREISNVVSAADKARLELLPLIDRGIDQKMLANTLLMFYSEIDKNQHPISYFEGIKGSFGDLKQLSTYEKYISAVFSSTMILDDLKWNSFTKNPNANVLQADAGFAIANAFLKNWQSKYLPQLLLFTLRKNDATGRYLKGMMEMDTLAAQKMYPDADSTLRVSYGSIQGVTNDGGVKLKSISTITQMIDQYKQEELPNTLIFLVTKKDFGIYADKLTKTLVTNFITNNDFATGNSGSPVLDGNGNLIGLVSTVNSEGLGFRYTYNPSKNRVICTDIRFVLWCIDKMSGDNGLIREMKILK